MPKYVFARASASFGNSVNRVRVEKDDVWHADDPFVLAHPEMFSEEPDPRSVKGAGPVREVEQATAAPGEKRAVRRG